MKRTPNQESNAEQEVAHIATDDRHRLLANHRRRVVLEVLVDWQTPIQLEDLAAEVASREMDTERTEKIMISLHHRHRPLLDELGAVDYDPAERDVRKSRSTLDDLTA